MGQLLAAASPVSPTTEAMATSETVSTAETLNAMESVSMEARDKDAYIRSYITV